jgi:hypothetical protein
MAAGYIFASSGLFSVFDMKTGGETRTRPRLSCLALLILLFGVITLLAGVAGVMWKPPDERWHFVPVVAAAFVILLGGFAAMYWHPDQSTVPPDLLPWLTPASIITSWGWGVLLATFVVLIACIAAVSEILDWLNVNADAGEVIVVPLSLCSASVFFAVATKLVHYRGGRLLRAANDEAD